MKIMKRNYYTIMSFLEKCRTMKDLKQVHGLMIVTSIVKNIIPCSKLIDFCANSEWGDIEYTRLVFDQIDRPSVYIWNSMIKGYCNGGDRFEALFMYEEMQRKGFTPDHFTFPFVLKVCSIIDLLGYGQSIHNRIVKTGFELDAYSSSCLLNMYVSCGDLNSGLKVFEFIPKWNVVAWTSLIAGFVNNDQVREALKRFKEMENQGVEPNEITMATVLAAAARCRDIDTGKSVHYRLRQLGYDPFVSNSSFNVVLATAIMDMYAKCGNLVTARKLFNKMPQRNLVVWNSLISAYSQYGRGAEALGLFVQMQLGGFIPDRVTFFSVISACTNVGFRTIGRSLHARVLKTSFREDVAIGTSLMDMYSKVGDADTALKIFAKLQKKDVMAWTTMILGLAIHGKGEEALHMFRRMEAEAVVAPDQITYIGVLWACSHLGLVEEGQKQFSSMTEVYGIKPTMEHYGCMIDLLSRAGHIEEAEEFLRKMPMHPNAAIWSSVLNGCEMYGNVGLADRVKRQIAELKNCGCGVFVLLSNIYARASKWQEVKLARDMLKHKRIAKTLGHSFVEQILRSQERGSKVIIFCSTKRLCDQLARNIGRGFGAAAIHGDKSQGERDWVLNQFRSGKSPILVATDVAARGLDIKDIRVVINYDFPTGIEDYVHRIGRTGRAGATGVSYTFLSEQDWKYAADLIKVLEGADQQVLPQLRDMAMHGGPSFGKDRGSMGRFDTVMGGSRWDSGGRGGMRDGGFGGRGGARDGGFGGRGGMRDAGFGGRGGNMRDGPAGGPGGRGDFFSARGRGGRGFSDPAGGHVGWGRGGRGGPNDRYNGMDGYGRGRGQGRFDNRRDFNNRSRGRSYSRSPERVRTWGYSRSRSGSRSSRSWSRSRSRSRSRSQSRSRRYSRSRSRSHSRSRSYDNHKRARKTKFDIKDLPPESVTSTSPGTQKNMAEEREDGRQLPPVTSNNIEPVTRTIEAVTGSNIEAETVNIEPVTGQVNPENGTDKEGSNC